MLSKRYRTWFTLFFLPLFPISKSRPFSECANCHAQFPLSTDEITTRVAEGERQQSAEAIRMYNSLRHSPANCVTLNDLIRLYGSLKEYDQAISAAAQFPQALHNSEQVMTALGRVHLAKQEHDKAVEWFDQAIDRNDQYGEPFFHRAVALSQQPEPDFAAATASARSARNLNHQGADELIQEIETKAGKSET